MVLAYMAHTYNTTVKGMHIFSKGMQFDIYGTLIYIEEAKKWEAWCYNLDKQLLQAYYTMQVQIMTHTNEQKTDYTVQAKSNLTCTQQFEIT